MGSVSFAALSVHTFVKSVGADAGFASIIGLAILVLLFFSQARETRTLREALEQADEQLGSLEAQLAAVSRAQATIAQQTQPPRPAQPPVVVRPLGSAAASVRQPAPAAALAQPGPLPAAPAGIAAPALGAATRLIPLPAGPAVGAAVPAAIPAGARIAAAAFPAGAIQAGAVAAASGSPVASAGTSAPAAALGPAEPGAAAGPPPATVAGAGAGNGHGPASAIPPPVGVAAVSTPAPPRVQLRPDAVATAPPASGPSAPAPAPGPARPASTSRTPARRARGERTRAGRLVPWLIGLVAVAVGVAALLYATGDVGHHAKHKAGTVQASSKRAHRGNRGHTRAAFKPSDVTVAVLNGTDVNGAAGDVGTELSHLGYNVPQSLVANAANQTQTTTVVSYVSGHRLYAEHVAKALKLKSSAVQPIDQDTLQVACPPGSSCPATVVVTIGQDLASTATSTTSTT